MTHATTNPGSIHPPLGLYSHTVRIEGPCRWLAIAGQVGVDPSGKTAEGFTAQTEQAFRNLLACLGANGMAKEDLVKLTVFCTRPDCIGEYRAVREQLLGEEVVPASTLLIVAGLAKPEFLIEIEGWAARSHAETEKAADLL